MQVVGLIGYVDKYDFVINLAKTINIMEKSVLVVDATLDRKLKNVIPALNTIGKSYVTQYSNIDFALGFNSMHDVENYMCEQGINIGLYDYILIDIDSPKSYEFFRSRGIDKHYIFIDTNILSINKNKEIIKAIRVYNQLTEDKMKLQKVYFKSYYSRAANDYFEKNIAEYDVEWLEPDYEVQMTEVDIMQNIDSQFSGIISIKKHSKMYIDLLADMAADLIEDVTPKMVKNQIKRRKE